MRIAGIVLLLLAGGIAIRFGIDAPLGAVIYGIAPAFLNTLQAGVQRRIAPELWDDVFLPALEWPGWVIPAVLGVALLLVSLMRGRRRGQG